MGATLGKSGGNFLDALPTQSTVHVVMLGLDSAGKTTALYRLKFDQYLNTVPTIGFNCEKVQGTLGKAKGVQFLVWDVGGQEKLRPLWRSYTRCTDGILFVVDSVDIERMEEAKMELLRTAKCPDNQGVPVLILANKQDLPAAQDPMELEKLLGLHELLYYTNIVSSSYNMNSISSTSSTTSATNTTTNSDEQQGQQQYTKKYIPMSSSYTSPSTTATGIAASTETTALSHNTGSLSKQQQQQHIKQSQSQDFHQMHPTTPTTPVNNTQKSWNTSGSFNQQHKCWFIQPACAITGEGLQEGLEALYEMILKRRKLHKVQKRRR